MACVAVTSLMRTLELEFLQSNPRLILPDKQHVMSLHKKLGRLKTFIDESEKKAEHCEELNGLIAKIRVAAMEAEYDIEAAVVDIHHRHQMLDLILRRVLQDVEELMDMIENAPHLANDLQSQNMQSSSSSPAAQSSSQHASNFEDAMVGYDKEFEDVKSQLLQYSNQPRQIMALMGMGGIGKTTFARRIYNDSTVKSHFDCWGWATMSQEHNKKQVLLELCLSVMPMRDDLKTKNDGELAEHLRRGLLGQRYLIVLDDIWTTEAWDDVKRCFPEEEENTGSQILLTTRLKNVAHYSCSGTLLYDMRFLNFNESWNLFRQKLLMKERLNKELETTGRNIVENCRGLPLTVVVVAGHLSANMAVDEWKSVESTLNSLVNLDLSEQFSRVFTLSYNNLPCHLKSCFLYLGVFPEDSEIVIEKVVRLWIAEGFITEVRQKTLEESGEEYLHDLINRSLIMISGRSSNGKVKTCKMHDRLHDLCASKAKNEKLLCTRDIPRHGSFVRSDGNRWLHLKVVYQSQQFPLKIDSNKSRSILCFDMREYYIADMYLVVTYAEMTADSFKMLRVLDLTTIDYNGSIPSNILLLRYLALTSNCLLTSIPVRRNWNLQTLVIREDINGVRKLPHGIWDLKQLRHLELYHQLSVYTPEVVRLNLQTMYWLHSLQCTEQVFSRIPNVKELGIIAQGCRCHCCLDNLNCLNKLEMLKVQGSYGPIKLPAHADYAFSQNLKKITLAKTLMPWEAMNVISMLPKLEVLKLKNHACLGQEWKLTVRTGFSQLKLLLISVTDLEHWKAADDVDSPLPALERLVLRNCFELKEMPSWIEGINNLKSIRLEYCNACLVESVRKIQEDKCDLCGEECAFEILEFHTQSTEEIDGQMYEEDIKMSVFLEARSLYIPHYSNPQYWRWTWNSGYEVIELLDVCWLEIKGTVDVRCLLKMTCYSAYLVFKLKPFTKWLDVALTSARYLRDKGSYNQNRRCQVFLAKTRSSEDPGRFPDCRLDGWMEIKLGDFYISSGNEGEVEMRLWNTKNIYWKSGLIVRGIEIRPT